MINNMNNMNLYVTNTTESDISPEDELMSKNSKLNQQIKRYQKLSDNFYYIGLAFFVICLLPVFSFHLCYR